MTIVTEAAAAVEAAAVAVAEAAEVEVEVAAAEAATQSPSRLCGRCPSSSRATRSSWGRTLLVAHAKATSLRTATSSKFESALKKGIEAHSNPAAASGGGGGPAGVLGGLAARLFRRGGGGGDGGGRDSATVAGRSVGVLERILRPW